MSHRAVIGPILVASSTVLTAITALVLGMPLHWVLLFVAVAFAGLFLVPRAATRSLAALDRTIQQHLQRREIAALLPSYRRAWPARLFAPRIEMRLRLAQVLIDTGDASPARRILQNALVDAEDHDLHRLLSPLVRACFLAGDDEGTLQAFRVLEEHGTPTSVHAYAAAHASLSLRKPPRKSEEILERHLDKGSPSDAAVADLARARIALVHGDTTNAAARLDAVDEAKLPREIRQARALTRAEILLAQDDRAGAEAALRDLAAARPENRFVWDARHLLRSDDRNKP